jgi:hypothetical protein
VSENTVLKRLFGAQTDDVIGKWRKMHKEELHDMYPSLNIIGTIQSRM